MHGARLTPQLGQAVGSYGQWRPPCAVGHVARHAQVSSELLGDVRLAARSRVNSGHVTALMRADRRSFRHYDNDSDARQRGTFVSVSLRAVWGPFILYAVVQKGSPLLSAIDELQPVRVGDVDLT